MERTVLEKSWRRNGPVGPSLEVIDDDDYVRELDFEDGRWIELAQYRALHKKLA
jgi:hypothetical protein